MPVESLYSHNINNHYIPCDRSKKQVDDRKIPATRQSGPTRSSKSSDKEGLPKRVRKPRITNSDNSIRGNRPTSAKVSKDNIASMRTTSSYQGNVRSKCPAKGRTKRRDRIEARDSCIRQTSNNTGTAGSVKPPMNTRFHSPYSYTPGSTIQSSAARSSSGEPLQISVEAEQSDSSTFNRRCSLTLNRKSTFIGGVAVTALIGLVTWINSRTGGGRIFRPVPLDIRCTDPNITQQISESHQRISDNLGNILASMDNIEKLSNDNKRDFKVCFEKRDRSCLPYFCGDLRDECDRPDRLGKVINDPSAGGAIVICTRNIEIAYRDRIIRCGFDNTLAHEIAHVIGVQIGAAGHFPGDSVYLVGDSAEKVCRKVT